MERHAGASPESFLPELNRLVEQFGRNLSQYKSGVYDEASLRQEFLDPLFRALGWDVENKAGLIPQHREVEIESRTEIAGRKKRADYLFRTDRQDRFICEAKKPIENLDSRYAFQAKRYAWNKGLVLAVLTDFEEMRIYVVGSKPHPEEEQIGLWRKWQFQEYPLVAQEIWNLLARSSIAEGSIEKLVEQLPRTPVGKGKARQQWLFKPDRTRTIDADFLNFLDEARRELASDLIRQNDRADLLEGTRLNEAVQRILDRLLFLRICEDRDIDTGRPLASILKFWRANAEDAVPRRVRPSKYLVREDGGAEDMKTDHKPPFSLWREVVAHFRALDHRPASQIPFFNGNLFKPHFSEDLVVGEDWLAHFLDEIGDEESAYLFNYIPVEILGIIYERFLGKIVRPQGRGVTIEEKPEARKAGGVYYTPRYIVEYIVAQTVGKLLEGRTLEEALQLRILDPACGSGSFLIHAFEVVSEHCQQWLTDHREKRKKDWYWVEENAVHLTAKAKRHILRETIHGVDIDPQAVEVTQLSLYLKMLEGENRATLARERELFGSDEALLPALEDNIKCGNSLIASDFSLVPDDLVRVHAFDWPVQFPAIMKAGGFDAVIGNPPYLYSAVQYYKGYFQSNYEFSEYQTDYYTYFIERALNLTKRDGRFSFIVSDSWLKAENFSKLRKHLLTEHRLERLAVFQFPPFEGATIENSILVVSKSGRPEEIPIDSFAKPKVFAQINLISPTAAVKRGLIDPRYTQEADKLVQKLEKDSSSLVSFADVNRGIHAYRTDGYGKSKYGPGPQTTRDKETQSYHAKKPSNKTFLAELKGKDVFRFESVPTGNFVSYGDWLAEPREPKYFLNPKVALRKVLGKKLHGTFLPSPVVLDQSLYVIIEAKNDEKRLKYLLGILLSNVGAWYLRTKYAIYDTLYPWYTRKQLASFPIKGESQRLVLLVDKMLALAPKLRAAKSDAERKTLQNAVTATDQQIDALVYELYGLTEDEIKLVEGTP
jgi:hypothetical protein